MTGIQVNCEQRTSAWYAARCGVITASAAKCLITKTGKVSTNQGAMTYLRGLVAERITRCVEVPEWTTPAMQYGIDHEPDARAWYEQQTGRRVTEVGFVYRDARKQAGCSPDGIVIGEGRGIEIKCRTAKEHIAVIMEGEPPPDDWMQMQFSMWVTGLPVWDYVAWSAPSRGIKSVIIPVERDEAMMDVCDCAVELAVEIINDHLATVSLGPVESWPPKPGAVSVVMPMKDDVDMEGIGL